MATDEPHREYPFSWFARDFARLPELRDDSAVSFYTPDPKAVMEAFDRMVREAKGE